MIEEELQQLISSHPVLFHMAERGSWPGIREHGLLSTTALLDLFDYPESLRQNIEAEQRPESVSIEHANYGQATIRDQKPMSDSALVRCLLDDLTPADWYRMLNARVFFWLTEDRLLRLLSAGSYASSSHDVLFVETAPLIENYRELITLAPINTGNTRPYPAPRGLSTFSSIENYPYKEWMAKRRRTDAVVELAVMDGVRDIERFTLAVKEMQGNEVIRTIWTRPT